MRTTDVLEVSCDLLMTWLTHKGLSKSTDNWNSMCFLSFLTHTIKTHITCENCKKSFKEKTLEIHWRVGDCNSSIMYTLLLVFFTLFPFNFHIMWEELSPNTIHTHSKSKKLTWSILEALGSCQSLLGAIGDNYKIREANKDKTRRSPLVAGAWRA